MNLEILVNREPGETLVVKVKVGSLDSRDHRVKMERVVELACLEHLVPQDLLVKWVSME